MGMIITLPDADFSGQGFPTLTSFGAFPASGQERLFKMLADASKYTDSSVNNVAATLDTTAGGTPPTFASGILSLPDTSGASQYTRLLTARATPTAFTGVLLVKQKADRLMYLFRNANGNGANCYISAGTLGYQFNNGTNRVGAIGAGSAPLNNWSVLAFAFDGTTVYGSKNGAAWSSVLYSAVGGAPSAAGDTLAIGGNQAASSIYADIALAGIWSRVLTSAELAGVYKAVKNVCRLSKTSIVLP